MGRAQLSDASGPCDIIGVIQGEAVESHVCYTVQDGHMSDLARDSQQAVLPSLQGIAPVLESGFLCSNSGLQETSTEAINPL